MRKTHTKLMKAWRFCEFCNFNSKTENEMNKHVAELKFTYRNIFTEETIQQTKDEISIMRENGYILHTEAMSDERIPE